MKLTWWEERACINTSASTFRFCNFGRPPTQISHLFKCFNLKFVGIISYSQPNYDKWTRKNLQNLQKKIIFHNKSAPYTNWELATKYNHLGQFFKKKVLPPWSVLKKQYYHLGVWNNQSIFPFNYTLSRTNEIFIRSHKLGISLEFFSIYPNWD